MLGEFIYWAAIFVVVRDEQLFVLVQILLLLQAHQVDLLSVQNLLSSAIEGFLAQNRAVEGTLDCVFLILLFLLLVPEEQEEVWRDINILIDADRLVKGRCLLIWLVHYIGLIRVASQLLILFRLARHVRIIYMLWLLLLLLRINFLLISLFLRLYLLILNLLFSHVFLI